jgi:hypothetical protein
MSADPNDAIQSLARMTAAAARLMAHMHHTGRATDPEDEITHMQANLDHVVEQVKDLRDPTWRYRL